MGFNWLEGLGTLASFLVLISLLMNAVVKLRVINTIGSLVFFVYGVLIGSIPVAVMNMGIVIINIYYLSKMARSKEYFDVVPIDLNSQYFQYFLKYHSEDIKKYFSHKDFSVIQPKVALFILKNTNPCGIFIASEYNKDTLCVELDYAIPAYRDFKMGNYLYKDQKNYFLALGYRNIMSNSNAPEHDAYLEKMGFVRTESQDSNKAHYIKTIV